MHFNPMLHLGPMNHTGTMKQSFLNKRTQSRLKPAHIVVKGGGGGVSCSYMSCSALMEEGQQKSKRLSYTAQFKHKVVQ
jgi:hypothetical protein